MDVIARKSLMSAMRNLLGRYLDEQASSVSSSLSQHSSRPVGSAASVASTTSSEGGSSFKEWLQRQPPSQPTQKRPSLSSSVEPGTITPATTPSSPPTRRLMPYRRVPIRPPPQLEPRPRGAHAAVYLTVTDFADNGLIYHTTTRALLRDCSIVIHPDPSIEKFSTYHLHWHVHPVNRLELYHINDLPDPRKAEPGLLAMDFLLWIPRKMLPVLDAAIKQIDIRTFTMLESPRWARIFICATFDMKLITRRDRDKALAQQTRDLCIDSVIDYPNYRE